jgi:flap endonuclease-1
VKEAEAAKEEAKEQGDKEALAKMNKRTVRVTPQHNAEAKRLLRLMGVPVIDAPCEAEAQCAALVQAGKVYGVATEDMDSLTLGTPLLLRHMTYSEARKMPIREIRLDKVLEGLNLSMESFIDLCILLGCDYSETIKGIGPKRALEQIRKYKSIDGVLKHLDKEKYPPPETFPYEQIREYFLVRFGLRHSELHSLSLFSPLYFSFSLAS